MIARFWTATAALAGLAFVASPALLHADEPFYEDTQYYEEDAWYDVSEWFDGNDYNPTDEAIGRWDDETYDKSDAITSADDDDVVFPAESDYGYFDADDETDDWYYDYNDYAYSDWSDLDESGMYEYSSQYYDTDNDGLYDAFASFYDSDGDGFYEDVNYYAFTDTDQDRRRVKRQATRDQKDRRANVLTLEGTVRSTKTVEMRSGKTLVLRLQGTETEQPYAVDFGPVEALAKKPKKGDRLQLTGPVMRFGDRQVLLTQQAEMQGQQINIDRSARQYTGKVVSQKRAKLMGRQHHLIKVKTEQGKNLMADVGPRSRFDAKLKQGDQVTVTGPAIKLEDRRVLVANRVRHDGNTMTIDRSPQTEASAGTTKDKADRQRSKTKQASDQKSNNKKSSDPKSNKKKSNDKKSSDQKSNDKKSKGEDA